MLLAGAQRCPVTVTERGTGHPFLLLHGGGGPATVTPWADRLAGAEHAHVIVPAHPGFNGTPRPDGLDSPHRLAGVYVQLLVTLTANPLPHADIGLRPHQL